MALDAALKKPEAQGVVAPAELPEERELVARLKAAERRVNNDIKLLLDVIQGQMSRGVAEAERQEQATRLALVGLSLLALSVGLLITLLAQRALAPIKGLTEAAQRLGRGAPDAVAAVPERGADELALLAREFNAMAQRLAARERELKAQSEALLRSERLAAIGRIAAQITHEIRNPLSAIGLNAEELGARLRERAAASGADEGASALALCDAIAREVDRLAAVTEEYLRFARLPRPQLAQVDLSPRLPALLADAGQLRQLLLNLVRNAKEAMPAGGELRISTSPEDDSAVVLVRDFGSGIEPERLQRIFDPFFTTKERGTGLGLALSQQIAQEHGGELSCESTSGAGATFRLRLPIRRTLGGTADAATPQPTFGAGLAEGQPTAEPGAGAAAADAAIAPS